MGKVKVSGHGTTFFNGGKPLKREDDEEDEEMRKDREVFVRNHQTTTRKSPTKHPM